MKNFASLFLIFLSLNCFAQNIIDFSLIEKTKLICEDVYKFQLKNDNWSINNYLYTLNEQGISIDTTTLENLVIKSLEFKADKWKKEDFKKAYLFKKGKKVEIKVVLSELKIDDKKQKKNIKRFISKYNNNPTKWRGVPISISRPVFSDNYQYCIIGFRFGNSGGYTELYEKINSNWKIIGIFNRFAF